MSNTSVLQTNTREQLDYVYARNSTYLDAIRSQMNTAKRKIINIQTEISKLKAAQLLVQQEINRNTKLNDIQKFYPADRYKTNDHIQAIKPAVNYGPDPDPRLNYTRNQLLKGNEQYEAEKNRIENEILIRSREIDRQRDILKSCQDQLNQIGATASTSITKDGISKRQYTEVYMLYQIHTEYASNTNRTFVWERQAGPSQSSKSAPLVAVKQIGLRLYPSDSGFLKLLNKLQSQFIFYAERSPFVVSGDLVLNLKDPGNIFNEKALYGFMDRLRTVMSNEDFTKYDTATKNYTSQMLSNVQEPFVSKYIQRQAESARVPDSTNSFRAKTSTPSENITTFINSVSAASTIAWDSTTLLQATLSNFNSVMSGLYGMPFCSKEKEYTPSTQQKMAADTSQAQVGQQSATIFSDQLNRTKNNISPEDVKKTADNLLADVAWAAADTYNRATPASYTLTVGDTIYVGVSLYQVRILNVTSSMLNSLDDMVREGNMDGPTYNNYIKYLNQILDEVWGKTAFQVTDGTGSFVTTP